MSVLLTTGSQMAWFDAGGTSYLGVMAVEFDKVRTFLPDLIHVNLTEREALYADIPTMVLDVEKIVLHRVNRVCMPPLRDLEELRQTIKSAVISVVDGWRHSFDSPLPMRGEAVNGAWWEVEQWSA